MQTVYGVKRNGVMLYVGKSVLPSMRWRSHFRAGGCLYSIASEECELVHLREVSPAEACEAEKQAIRSYWAKGQCAYNKRCASVDSSHNIGTGGKFVCPELVLGGGGWTLREFYTEDGLEPYMKDIDLVKIVDLETFVTLANQGKL